MVAAPSIRRRAWSLRPTRVHSSWRGGPSDRRVIESVLLGILGLGAGWRLAKEESGGWLSGLAWVGTADAARKALATIFGLELTALGIVLSVSVLVLQVTANQYSPRLQALYARTSCIRRGLPIFALASAYLLTGAVTLGTSAVPSSAPRPVVGGAFVLLVACIGVLVHDLLSTFANLRIEVILRLLAESALKAHRHADAQRARVGGRFLTPSPRAANAAPIRALQRGYIVDVDVGALARHAATMQVCIHVDRWVGDFVDDGEIIGWISNDADGNPEDGRFGHLARAVCTAKARSAARDVGFLLRMLTDIADRALSPAVNDPYTARQALNECRTVLRRIASDTLGDWGIVDAADRPRVVIASPKLRDHLAMVVDGPLRFGASDSDVCDAVLALALEVGLASADAAGRADAVAVAHRVLVEARGQGQFEPARLRVLEATVARIEAAIVRGVSPTNNVLHPTWGLPAEST